MKKKQRGEPKVEKKKKRLDPSPRTGEERLEKRNSPEKKKLVARKPLPYQQQKSIAADKIECELSKA